MPGPVDSGGTKRQAGPATVLEDNALLDAALNADALEDDDGADEDAGDDETLDLVEEKDPPIGVGHGA